MFCSLIESIFPPFLHTSGCDKEQEQEEITSEEIKYDISTIDTIEFDEDSWVNLTLSHRKPSGGSCQ